MRIVHATSVHPLDDGRILYKECVGLAEIGHDVTLIGPGLPVTENVHGVHVAGVGPARFGRWGRILTWYRLFRTLRRLAPDVIHVHDPELLLLANLFVGQARCVYDAHELLAESVMEKPWIPRWCRGPLSRMVGSVELALARRLGHVVTADPVQDQRFTRAGISVCTVRNLPLARLLGDLSKRSELRPHLVHVGAHSEARGIRVMLEAAALLSAHGVKVTMVGKQPAGYAIPANVTFTGRVRLPEVVGYLREASIGLIALQNTIQYSIMSGVATKCYEYMAAGLPIVASDIPPHRRLIEAYGCGRVFAPESPREMADAVLWLLANADAALQMGSAGRSAFESAYRFEKEAERLSAFYDDLA